MDDFKLKFFTRRWKSDVTLNVKKTDKGWHISHMAINGDTDQEGAPILVANLRQDNVEYPVGVGRFLGFIWQQLDDEDIDSERAQQMFDEVGKWISTCESSQPVWKPWNA